VASLLRTGYQLVATLRAWRPGQAGNVYDLQDGFYLPFAGFKGIARPGPNFYVYKHPDVPILSPPGSR